MSILITTLLASLVAPGPSEAPAAATANTSSLQRYLRREVPGGEHFLDHGVMALEVAGGWPHRYRVAASIGVLDHLSVGVSARWLPSESRPRWAPQVALAVWRKDWWAFGFRYSQVLHLPSPDDVDPTTPDFAQRTHYLFGSAVFARGPLSAGVDVGALHTRSPMLDPAAEPGSFRKRLIPAGGLFFRYGGRRWGLSVGGQMPVYTLEFKLDLRFGLFEQRRRGGWVPPRLSGA